MVVHAYVLTHHEAYVIPYWLRCYGAFADRLFVVDHASADGTRAALEARWQVVP